MSKREERFHGRTTFGIVAFGVIAACASACGPNQGGLAAPTTAEGGAGGSTGDSSGSSGRATASTSSSGGSSGVSSSAGGAPGTGGKGGSGGTGGDPGDAGPQIPACVFHTDPVVEAGVSPFVVFASDGGADASDPDAQSPASEGGGPIDGAAEVGSPADASGEGGPRPEGGTPRDAGDAGPAPSITVLNNAFVGNYLADSAGRTLYTYGADFAGDCNYAPISNCATDCLVAWPLFNANPRTLAPSLDDHAFGSILRADGAYQTTYFGWPLYYYKTDTGPGVLGGQAKAKTWHAATVIPLGIFIMKGTTAAKYLGDGAGHTLYVYDADTKGTATSDPTSACADACLTMHPAFRRNRISVVSSLEPTDFTIFVQGPLGQQVAYRGAPLYYSSDDFRSGDQKGATTPGWSIAIP